MLATLTPIFLLLGTLSWILLYWYFTRHFNHWKNKNVSFIKPLPFFGNVLDVFLLRKSIGQLCQHIYEKSTGPFVGWFICDEPCLMVRDPNLIKQILIKDFTNFNNRILTQNKEGDPLGSYIMFILKAPAWREIRRKMTPAFTSGKMKLMYRLIDEVGADMVRYLEEHLGTKGSIVEVREMTGKYSTDTITSTAFGLHADSFRSENNPFREASRRIFNWAYFERAVSTTAYFMAPSLVKLFNLKFIHKESAHFLRDVFWDTMNEREVNPSGRNDLIDILIQIKKEEAIDDPLKLEGNRLVAQALQFFMAGYETTSTTITFALYELALHHDLQEITRNEIEAMREKNNGQMTYDALKDMDYLDRVIKETLRKYPALPFLDRRCNEDYTIPDTKITLNAGTPVFIPTVALHYDPCYYPNPHKFDPDRFLDENIANSTPFTYLPFGEGPRNCIGARYGTLSSKLAVAHIISQFRVDVCAQTQSPMKLDSKGFLTAPVGGLRLRFEKI